MPKLRFHLTVDSGSPDEPSPRRFGSLQTAYEAFETLDPEWKKFTWITEDLLDGSGSKTHMKDGVLLPLSQRTVTHAS